MNNKLSDIKKDGYDYLLEGAKVGAAIGSSLGSVYFQVPNIIGPTMQSFFNCLTPSLQKRRDEWFDMLAERIEYLIKKVDGISYESLCNNENFITCVIEASQIALKTANKEKIKCLRNIVLNSASFDISEDKLKMYLIYMDKYTYTHIKILKFIKNIKLECANEIDMWKKESDEILYTRELFLCKYPEYKAENQEEFVLKLFHDLFEDGMIGERRNVSESSITQEDAYESLFLTEEIGQEFLNLIEYENI